MYVAAGAALVVKPDGIDLPGEVERVQAGAHGGGRVAEQDERADEADGGGALGAAVAEAVAHAPLERLRLDRAAGIGQVAVAERVGTVGGDVDARIRGLRGDQDRQRQIGIGRSLEQVV